ncbi:hypothetical protein JW979_10630 [bacterium]|nr:hypothetical protein [candidate division CSSED10-310 bacterium]
MVTCGLSAKKASISQLEAPVQLKSSIPSQSIGMRPILMQFDPSFTYYFQKNYGYLLSNQTEENSPLNGTSRSLLNNTAYDMKYSWFPDINSKEYEVGYGLEEISAGEQLLYSLGFLLLQYSAMELDRSINSDDRNRSYYYYKR